MAENDNFTKNGRNWSFSAKMIKNGQIDQK